MNKTNDKRILFHTIQLNINSLLNYLYPIYIQHTGDNFQ